MKFRQVTEENSLYDNLEQQPVRDLLRDINREDHRVADAVEACLPQVEAFVVRALPRIQQGGRLFYIGAGTSGRLGVLDASEIPPTFGMPEDTVIGIIAGGEKALRHAVEQAEDHPEEGWKDVLAYRPTEKDCLIGISASGTTPYVLGAIAGARKHGLLTAGICSNPDSPLSEAADISIEIVVGPEFITGSSRMKSGTGQKMILNMISTVLMIKLGKIQGNSMVNMRLSNRKLMERGIRILQDKAGLTHDESRLLLQEYKNVSAVLERIKEMKQSPSKNKVS